MTHLEIARARLRAQGIGEAAFSSPAAVVEGLGAVQAQEIATNIFRLLTSAEKNAVLAAAQRYGQFLGLPVVMDTAILGSDSG